ncbi:glycosyltransferase [Azospirillum sp. ST 5-10]|uniref:glycosyltransferase n=1 Tax=unclassified Azospirillum TaxID=2630922 RepID=UPI003F4A5CE9
MSTPHAAATPPRRPVVLVVAMSNSVHTARWLDVVRGRGISFVLLPVAAGGFCHELSGLPVVRDRADVDALPADQVSVFPPECVDAARVAGLDTFLGYAPWLPSFMDNADGLSRPAHLLEAITRLRPALVHSLETQFAGYLCMAVKRLLGPAMPPWMLSSWGSDVYLYRKVPDEPARLREIARSVDAYLSDSERDVALFRDLGYTGPTLPVMPASGGIDIDMLPSLDSLPPPSRRREILVKGLHGWSGRALSTLAAIHLAAPALTGFTIGLLSPAPVVADTARTLSEWDGLAIDRVPHLATYRDVIRRIAGARAVVGVGISDGTPTVMLEAMSVGTFPIQSDTSAADEWLVPGKTGFLVSPHDVAGLARMIVRAATDDALVDGCVAANRRVVEERWNARINGPRAVGAYRTALSVRDAADVPLKSAT